LKNFNIVIVGQSGRLQYEAVLFAATFRASDPNFAGKLFLAEPEPNHAWPDDPRIVDPNLRDTLTDLGVTFVSFQSNAFGQYYPNGNKIECLSALPKGEPFVFFDTDTVITGDITSVPFDFDRPGASPNVEGTWPEIELYGPGYTAIWKSLYDLVGLDFDASLDTSQPDEYWRRYAYYNAGYFYYKCPHEFGARYLEYAKAIRDTPPKEIECQTLYPWLDQIALPLVIQSFGGGRDALPLGLLDGTISTHYRYMALLYATAPDAVINAVQTTASDQKIKRILKEYDPFKRFIYQNAGTKARTLFDQSNLPSTQRIIRKRLKNHKLWVR
jgi:hypothetical protein